METEIKPLALRSSEKENGRDDEAYRFAIETPEMIAARAEKEAILKGIGELDDDQNAAVMRKQMQLRRTLKHAIPISFLVSQSRRKLEASRLSNELLWYIPFLVLFIIVFLAGKDVEGAYWVGASLAGQVGEGQCPAREDWRALRPGEVAASHVSLTLNEVKTVDEWHFVFETQTIDFFYSDGPDTTNPPLANNWMAGFNLKIGSIRLRTLRVRSDSCTPSRFLEQNATECYGPFSLFSVNESDFSIYPWKKCDSRLRVTQGVLGAYPCDGNTFEIPWNLGHDDAVARAQLTNTIFTNDTDIIDLKDTRFIAIEFLSYQPTIDFFGITIGYTEISAGGAMVHTYQTYAFQVWTPNTVYIDVLWCLLHLMVFVFVLFYFQELVIAKRDGRALQWFLSGWNLLELVNLITFLVIMSFRIAWWVESVKLDFVLPGKLEYDTRFEYVEWLYRIQVFGGAFNVVITFLKTLKYVELNPQLAVVTNTLGAAAQNLIGILIIFFVVLAAYSLAAVSLFSNGVSDFRDFETSLSTLLRVLLGDFDYEPMRQENRYLAGIFFWSYVILALFMLLNFFVGVIGNAFEDEHEKAKTEPLHETVASFFAELEASIKEFFESPKAFITEALQTRRSKYAEFSQLDTLTRALQAHRESLPIGASAEELQSMSEEEKQRLLPDPFLTFHDIKVKVFPSAFGEQEGVERYNYVGDRFLTAMWVDVVRQFALQDGDTEAAQAEELEQHIQETTEEALRFVLGLSTSTEHRTTKEMLEVQDLFAPKAMTLKRIAAMTSAVTKLETYVSSLINATAKLDEKVKKS